MIRDGMIGWMRRKLEEHEAELKEVRK